MLDATVRIVPEGHTIHRLAADLRKDFVSKRVEATSPQGRFAESAALLNGIQMIKSEAWGKHLFCHWENGNILHVHLGLIGKFRKVNRDDPPRDTIRLRLVYESSAWHLTGPQTCALITEDDLQDVINKLGPDPLRVGLRGMSEFKKRLGESKKPIGAALLDQNLLAGIGNVYRAELLFLCGIHPETPCNKIHDYQAEELWKWTVDLLRRGKKLNRIVTIQDEDKGTIKAKNKKRNNSLYAYKRAGLDCRRCPDEIVISKLAGRSIWHCPNCQKRT